MAKKESTLKIIIIGEPRSKKNSSRIISINGRPSIVPSKQYKQYEKYCLLQLFNRGDPIDYPVNVRYTAYMKTRRRVDGLNLWEALDDILVKAHILKDDDRDIVAGHDGSRVFYDKDNPRVEIEISAVDDYEKWRK